MSSEFDLFLSHTEIDKRFVRRLALDLNREHVKVWFDDWELGPGDSLRNKIGQAITSSAYVAIILSPASVESKWVQAELNAAFAHELELKSVFILPVLHKKCNIPPFLKDKVYADFTADYQKGLKQLLKRLKRAETALPPQFVFGEIHNKRLRDEAQTILNELANVLQTNVSLITADGCRLRAETGPEPEYYELLAKSLDPSLHPAAREWEAFHLTAQRKASLQHECAFLTIDSCMPVLVSEKVVASFFTGQVVLRDIDDSITERLKRQEREDKLKPGTLVNALRKVKRVTRKDINKNFKIMSKAAKKLSKVFEHKR